MPRQSAAFDPCGRDGPRRIAREVAVARAGVRERALRPLVRQSIRLRSGHPAPRRRRAATACVRYVRQPDGTCHFKSNDGHYAHWNFPLTRHAPIADRQPSLALSRLCLQAEHPRCASRSQAQWAHHRRFDAQRKALSRQVRPVRRGQRVSGSADGSRCGVGAHAQTETSRAPLRRDCAASARPSRSGAAYSIACAPAGSAQPPRPPPSRNSTCRHGSPVRRRSTREYQPRDPTRGGGRGAVLEYCTGVV